MGFGVERLVAGVAESSPSDFGSGLTSRGNIMSRILRPRTRRTEYRPAIDRLEIRAVPAVTPLTPLIPANIAALPAQIATLGAKENGISNYVVSQVNFALSVGGHVGTPFQNYYAATYATAQGWSADIENDIEQVQTFANDTYNGLVSAQAAWNTEISTNYTNTIAFISNYYNSLTPSQQAAQQSTILANITNTNTATASAFKTVKTYYTAQENAVISLYNSYVPNFNSALFQAANAVRLSGNLYNYTSFITTTPLPLNYTPLKLIPLVTS
jgi:hypothetical protein